MSSEQSNIIFDNVIAGSILRVQKQGQEPFLIITNGNATTFKGGNIMVIHGKWFNGNNYIGYMFCKDYMEPITIERDNYECSLVPIIEFERILEKLNDKLNREINLNIKHTYETIRDLIIQTREANVKVIQKAIKSGIKIDPKRYISLFSSLTGYHNSIENTNEPVYRTECLFNNPNAAKLIKSSLGIVPPPVVIKGRAAAAKRMIKNE
jgi:hypothetical protein